MRMVLSKSGHGRVATYYITQSSQTNELDDLIVTCVQEENHVRPYIAITASETRISKTRQAKQLKIFVLNHSAEILVLFTLKHKALPIETYMNTYIQ